jgi:outer membrane protein
MHGILAVLVCLVTAPSAAHGFPDMFEDPLRVNPDRLRIGARLPDGSPVTFPASVDLSQQLELGSAIDIALCNNPEISSAWASIKIQSSMLGEARAAYLPSMRFSVNRLANWGTIGNIFDSADSFQIGSQFYGTFSWRLLDFSGRGASSQAASHLLSAALAAHDASMQKTMTVVVQAYFDAMTAQSMVTARKKMTKVAEDILAATKRREGRGLTPLSDILQAETAVARALLNEARAKGDFNKSMSLLVQSMGLSPGTCLNLPQSLDLYRVDDVRNLNEWLQEAEEQHPAIRQARAKLAADKAKITVVRSEGLPSLDATATVSINGYPNQGLSYTQQSVKTVGVMLNVPIFEGFGRTYKIRGAQAQAEQSQAQLQETTSRVLTEIVKAHADALTSLETLKASERLLQAAKLGLQSSLRRYDYHAADIIEVLNSQSSLADAEQERIHDVAEWRSARLRLLSTSGKLGRADLQLDKP